MAVDAVAPLPPMQQLQLHNGSHFTTGDVGDVGNVGDSASSLVGQLPPKRHSRKTLVKRHNAHLKTMPDPATGDNEARPVKQVILSEAYPASYKSIRELDVMPLAALRIETHHRGRMVVVQAATAAYRGVGSVSVVVDAAGDADKLAVYNHSDTSLLSNLPAGCVVAVKEPYYKRNEVGPSAADFMICVDHPSDVVLLRFDDPLVPAALQLPADSRAALDKTPHEWRAAGDMAFLQRDLPTAAFCYTEAVAAAKDTDAQDTGGTASTFTAGVYAKRAGVNLLLGRYDGARDDALASCTGHAATDWRAYYTAARAAYGLCHYETSRAYFAKALDAQASVSSTVDAALKRESDRCLARLREETEGTDEAYDFPAMYASLSLQTNPVQVHLDRGSFLRKTAVRRSAFHGNGLFATEDMAAGDIVFVEKAAFMPSQYLEPARASAALYATMVRHMCDNPSVAAEVLQPLYGGDLVRSGREGTLVDGVPVVDVFLAETIRVRNCFSAPLATLDDTRPEPGRGRGPGHGPSHRLLAKGVWKHASYLNHSCVPNTMRAFLGDVLISRATRPIRAGDELFHQYVPVKADVRARQAELQACWGFVCACPLCRVDAATDATDAARAGHAHRRSLLQAVEKLANKHPPQRFPPDAAVRAMERLAKQMVVSYDADAAAATAAATASGGGDGGGDDVTFGPGRPGQPGQPRLGLVYPTMWLLRAHRCRRRHAKVLQYAAQTLRCFGYGVPSPSAHDDGSHMYSQPGMPLHTVHVVSALAMGGEAHRALGHDSEADAFGAAARLGFRMVTGFSEDVSVINEDDEGAQA
ncbi:hypothetical protein HMPREF1624_07418 [Sporothrix schenckii ATCC 58251]|uniref:SET domain-containing protein n=1 Tax=Sporothrix schenckii (strain ATCC 58251 / de Perez 2211183) TaxID=1391915 RepID=U7PLR3_SPOS1|nr:hypothetical protein HMPREF1624_07418 [Sporothrix schenckii ATCC 58251]